MAEFLALRETFGLVTDLLMDLHCRAEAAAETLAFVVTQCVALFKAIFDFEAKGFDRFAKFKKLPFGLTNELHEDVALTATASAKASHDFFEFLSKTLSLVLEPGAPKMTLPGNVVDEF